MLLQFPWPKMTKCGQSDILDRYLPINQTIVFLLTLPLKNTLQKGLKMQSFSFPRTAVPRICYRNSFCVISGTFQCCKPEIKGFNLHKRVAVQFSNVRHFVMA